MINPPEPTTTDEIIAAAATLLAPGCTVQIEGSSINVRSGRRFVMSLHREGMARSCMRWTIGEPTECQQGCLVHHRAGLDWADVCDLLRGIPEPEQQRANTLPTGYDPVTLSQVLRAAVDFGEATRAGDHGRAATALEVIRGHEALAAAGSEIKPLTWRSVPPRPKYATPENVQIGDSVAPDRYEIAGAVERIEGGWMFVRMPDGALVQTDIAAWADA